MSALGQTYLGNSVSEETAAIPVSTLHNRLQDEILSLVVLASEVQIALGPTIAETKNLSPSVQRSLQAIDRLHQTLDDIQRVMGHLANCEGDNKVSVAPLSSAIKLRHLAHKLFDNIDAPFALTEDDSGDISWF